MLIMEFRVCSNIIGTIIIIIIIIICQSTVSASPRCPPVKDKDCSCSSSLMKVNNLPGFEIICQKDGEKAFYLEFNPNTIELECGSRVPFKDDMFEEYDIRSKNYVFVNCPLPNMTITNMVNSVDINSLSFTCGGQECNQTQIDPKIFKNLITLKGFILSHFQINSLPIGLFKYTPELISVRLDFNQLKNVPETLLEHVSELENLSLSNNFLTSIPASFLRNLKKLKMLYLNNNKLTYLSPGIFKDLISLEVFNAKDNLLDRLDPYTFARNANLKQINMGGNALTTLEGFSLANMTNITSIDLSSNTILGKIDFETFGNSLPNLTDLYISNCDLSELPGTLFMSLPRLSKLDLSFNAFNYLPGNLFERNSRLTYLELSFNNLSVLPAQIFRNQRALQTLNIKKNAFTSIPKESLSSLEFSLKTLNMDKNNILRISAGDLDDLKSLEILSLSRNLITSLPHYQMFGLELRNLSEINLSFNNLSELVVSNWEIYTSLRKLDLSYNRIGTFSIPRLFSIGTEVNLMNNQIQFVDCQDIKNIDDAFNTDDDTIKQKNYYTSVFRLSFNPFNCDCNLLKFKKFMECPLNTYRRKLFPDMRNYQCNKPSNLKNSTLITLDDNLFICQLYENCPIGCDCYLKAEGNVTIVDCSKTVKKITKLPSELPFNTTLLNLKNNYITSLSNSMKNTTWNKLRVLNLDNNSLSLIDYELPLSLVTITLTGNKLQSIPQSFNNIVTKNRVKISLGNNPWVCNCSAKTLRNLLSFQYESVEDFLNITCSAPEFLKGRTMENVTEWEICPGPISKGELYISLAVIAAIIVLLSFILCVLYYRNKRTIIAYLYIHYFKIYSIFFKEDFDEDKYYHAFISYSSADRDIALALIDQLENGAKEPRFKLCIHERDWQPGNLITYNIVHSVQNSRRTILVLSEDFIKSVWFQLEFHIAYYQMLQDKIDRLIIIVKGKLPDKDDLDKDLQILLMTKTYLEWGEKWFWEKLRYALPHRNVLNNNTNNINNNNNNNMGEISEENASNDLVRKIEGKIMELTATSMQSPVPVSLGLDCGENIQINNEDIELSNQLEIIQNINNNKNNNNNNNKCGKGILNLQSKYVPNNNNESRI